MGTAVSSLEDEHSTRANELPDSYRAKKEITWVSWWCKAENAEIEIQIHTCLDYTDPSPPTHDQLQTRPHSRKPLPRPMNSFATTTTATQLLKDSSVMPNS